MCIWCQLFSRAESKTRYLYSHHNVVLIGAFCCLYKAGLGITVELNLAIMYAESLLVGSWCACPVCFPQHPFSTVPEPYSFSLVKALAFFFFLPST